MKKYLHIAVLIIASTFLLNGSCGSDSNPAGPTDPGLETKTFTVQPTGSTCTMSDSSKVVFPAGAVSVPVDLKITRLTPSRYFSGSGEYVILSFESSVTQFDKEVEIHIPSPLAGENILGAGGQFDPETGIIDVSSTEFATNNGKKELVIKTNHFSDYAGHFWQMPPTSAGPLEISYYNQGSTQYCWATCLQMMLESVAPNIDYEIFEWIRATGIDETGAGQEFVLKNKTLATIIESRTGVKPEAKRWQYMSAKAMDTYLRHCVALGYPVLVMDPFAEHATLVVGYDGNTFYIHNPASTTNSQIGYTAKQWSEFRVGELGIRDLYVTLAIPTPVKNQRMSTLNLSNGMLSFVKPKTGSGNSMIYGFKWAPTATGYGLYENNGTGTKVDTLPDGVQTLKIKGIEIANADRSAANSYRVWVDVWGENNEKKHKSFAPPTNVALGANAMGGYSIDIPVADFRDSSQTATVYKLTASLMDQNSALADQVTIHFAIAPPDILSGSWAISFTRVSTTSPKGTYGFDEETMTFLFDVVSPKVLKMSSEEGEIQAFDMERSADGREFTLLWEESEGSWLKFEAAFATGSSNRFTGTLSIYDYQYLTYEDEQNDRKTWYTSVGSFVGTRVGK